MSKNDKLTKGIMYTLIGLAALVCVFPLLITFMVSFTDEATLIRNGYSLFPKKLSLMAYQFTFKTLGHGLLNGYKITILSTVLGTFFSMTLSSCYAFAASLKNFKHRNILNLLIYIPMVFSAGLLPWYIICTKYYGLSNNFLALILPAGMNLFNVFLIRNFFSAIPNEIYESTVIDGAGMFTIFTRIYLPLAKVGLITVSLFYALQFWNDFYLPLMFIRKTELFSLQYYIYSMLSSMEFLVSQQDKSDFSGTVTLPMITVRMAVTCITIGPVILLYPFLQKYFVKGVIIGAVKG